MNPYILYAVIGSLFGIYAWRSLDPKYLRYKADGFLKLAQSMERHGALIPVPTNAVAAFLIFLIWPFAVGMWAYGRLYIMVFGSDFKPWEEK